MSETRPRRTRKAAPEAAVAVAPRAEVDDRSAVAEPEVPGPVREGEPDREASDEPDLEAEPDLGSMPPPELGDDGLEGDDPAELGLEVGVELAGDGASADGDAAAVRQPFGAAGAGRHGFVRPSPARHEAQQGIVRYDPLTAYVQELRHYPLLSREEEHELAVKYFETGEPAIARRLVTSNLRLVVKIAHEYRRAYRNLLDMVQEGNIGLMQAVRKYDPYRGVKLSSYAAWWIRAYILKFILNNWRLVKIGTTQAQRKLFFNLRKEKERLERLGFEPEHRLLAERLDVSEQEVAEMDRRLGSSDMSLDAPISRDDAEGPTRMDALPSAASVRPDVRAEHEEFQALLRSKLEEFGATLNGRDQVLFRERWLTETPLTLQEIGDRFGISRERARQIEKRMLGKLRKHLEAELGSAVDIGEVESEE